MSGILQAGRWWVQDYLYAAGRQLLSAISRTRPDEFLSGTGRPVVVIPGVYEDWRFMLPLVRRLHEAGHPVHVLTLLHRNRLAVPRAADLIAGYIRDRDLSDAMLVAHSKGGLIGKFVMMQLDPERRIAGMVAVCSPFSGSRYASFMLLPSLRAFSPRNAVTMQLSREERVNERITSVYGLFDPHIPEGSVLPGARNIRLDTAGHFRILAHEDTIRTILDIAAAPSPGRPAPG
ncbi:alpha/beta hydrolase [Micrococcaceae bacterium Sec7.4]